VVNTPTASSPLRQPSRMPYIAEAITAAISMV
jgi:hypothetical protein